MKGIRIIAKVDGFRRAGLTHTGVQEYPRDSFTPQQLEQLRTEPNLVIQDIDLPDDDGSDNDPVTEGAKGRQKAARP